MDLALHTTIHPGIRPFLKEWYESVCEQTDLDFDLWIGIDAMSVDEARTAMGAQPEAHWVKSEEGDTPAQVRERTWRALLPHADAVVMADADDVLHPERVQHAREQIEDNDLAGCALRLIDPEGDYLGHTMPPERYASAERALPAYNIFGLTNTTHHSSLLKEYLPLPKEVMLVDWYLATRAWIEGRDLLFDQKVQMEYRQHGGSTLSLLPPFTSEQIREATRVVRQHFRVILENPPSDVRKERWKRLKQAANRVRAFANHAFTSSAWLNQYTKKLNQLPPLPLWWACVAHPDLEFLWTQSTPSE
ncbi:hypothetical protein [Salinibacter sp.]|uniref:hypothetical protein n=1 Tax=Salinibacter sp. TaxID=2065818 RepID=UPI0021E72963|nr:hypothetical protein [Salinibacter sp.]